MHSQTNRLFILLNEEHVMPSFFSLEKNLFTFNKHIISDNLSAKTNHKYPNAKKTANESKKLFLTTQILKKIIIKELKYFYKKEKIRDLDELLDPFLEIKISSYLYMKSVIPNYDEYILIYKKRRIKYQSKIDLIIDIESINNKEINSQYNFLYKYSTNKLNLYNGLFMKIQSFLLKKIFDKNKKNFNFFSDRKAYFMSYLLKKNREKKSQTLYYSPNRALLSTLKILFIQLIKFIYRKDSFELGFFLLPFNQIPSKTFDLTNKINHSDFYSDKKYINNLLIDSNILLKITLDFKNYLKTIFNKVKICDSFFHTVRFPDNYSLSRVFADSKKNVSLISHGSHTIQNDNKLNRNASKVLGIGMSFSLDDRIKLLSQSKFCDDYLDSLNKKYSKINFIISQSNFSKKDITIQKTKSKTTILYAGTVKELGSRRYYYESSQEFFESIQSLYKKLYAYKKNILINICIRDVHNEINQTILDRAFKKYGDFIKIKYNSPLKSELKLCDCLISYSSTVLEEGLHMSKPVMCYGLPKYNHLKYYEKFNNDEIENNLKLIENCLERRFIFNMKSFREIEIKL